MRRVTSRALAVLVRPSSASRIFAAVCVVLIFCLTAIIASPAQTPTTPISFNGPSPYYTMNLLRAADGNVHGTSRNGGAYSGGTLFTLSMSQTGVLTSPMPGSQLPGSTVTFTWDPGTQSTAYWLDLGSTAGGNNYYQSGNLGNTTSATVNSLPADGSTIYVTLWSQVGGQWYYNEYTYTSAP